MVNRFRQPYSEHALLVAVTDTLTVLDELVGPIAGCATRPCGNDILRVYLAFFRRVDGARAARDMLALYEACRDARGSALDVLHVAAEERQTQEVSG